MNRQPLVCFRRARAGLQGFGGRRRGYRSGDLNRPGEDADRHRPADAAQILFLFTNGQRTCRRMVVTLIGYRGSGKSSVAGPLAERLGWAACDADAALESAAGATIREIFAAEGEAGFRRREQTVLAELLQRDRWVIAAGGGAVLSETTRRAMRAAGPVIWLQAAPATLWARIAGDATTAARRPNLARGGLAEIQDLLAAREPFYRECATFTIDTEGLAVAQIVDEAWRLLQTVWNQVAAGK